jgi:hypothetical protein
MKSYFQWQKIYAFLQGNVTTYSNSDRNYEREKEKKRKNEQKALFDYW